MIGNGAKVIDLIKGDNHLIQYLNKKTQVFEIVKLLLENYEPNLNEKGKAFRYSQS